MATTNKLLTQLAMGRTAASATPRGSPPGSGHRGAAPATPVRRSPLGGADVEDEADGALPLGTGHHLFGSFRQPIVKKLGPTFFHKVRARTHTHARHTPATRRTPPMLKTEASPRPLSSLPLLSVRLSAASLLPLRLPRSAGGPDMGHAAQPGRHAARDGRVRPRLEGCAAADPVPRAVQVRAVQDVLQGEAVTSSPASSRRASCRPPPRSAGTWDPSPTSCSW